MLGKYNRRTVNASTGAVAPGATVSFYWQATGTPAIVYADQDGNNPLGSSVLSDADGRIAVFVTPGLYRIVTTLDGDLIDELTHEPIVGQLAYADPNSYALRSELKLHDEDIQLVAKSVTDLKLAGGPRLASGRVLATDEIGMLADTGAMIKTTEYHDGTSIGDGEYQLRTLTSYRVEIGDAAWVPDGYGNHFLLGSATYIALLQTKKPLSVEQFGARGDGTDDTVAIQQCLDHAVSILFPDATYLVSSQIVVPSTVKYVEFRGQIATSVAGAADSNHHPSLLFTEFSGQVTGNLKIVRSTHDANCTTDGVKMENCVGFRIESIEAVNVRFGTILIGCEDYQVSNISGTDLRGYQDGFDDNGGSVVTMAKNKRGYISHVNGIRIRKAACYLSITAEDVDNSEITIDKVHVTLTNSSRAVANGFAIRSGVGVTVGEINSTGGISGVFIARASALYNVDDINLGRIRVLDNSDISSNSNGVHISGASTYPVGTVRIGSAHCEGAAGNSVFINYVNKVMIGHVVSQTPSGRGLFILGNNGHISFDTVELNNAVSQEILFVSGSYTESATFGDITIADRGSSGAAPVSVTEATCGYFKAGSIVDKTAAPVHGSVVLLGSTLPSSYEFDIISITANTNAVSVRGDILSSVKRGRLYRGAIPAGTAWPIGYQIYNDAPVSGSPHSWVQTVSGFVATAVLA